MFVGGLSWQTTPEKLREYFGAYGTVRDVLIMKDPVTQVRIFFSFLSPKILFKNLDVFHVMRGIQVLLNSQAFDVLRFA